MLRFKIAVLFNLQRQKRYLSLLAQKKTESNFQIDANDMYNSTLKIIPSLSRKNHIAGREFNNNLTYLDWISLGEADKFADSVLYDDLSHPPYAFQNHII